MKMFFKKFFKFLKEVVKLFLNNDVLIFAGCSSFFLIISSIPLFMLMFSTISIIPTVDIDDFVTNFNLLIPNLPYITDVVKYIMNVAKDLSASSVIYINIITALITASTVLFSFTVGIKKIHNINDTKNYIIVRIVTIINIVILYFSIIFTIIFFILGKLLLTYANKYLPMIGNIISIILNYKYLAVGIALMVLSLSLYTCCTNFERKYSKNIFGAIFTTISWLLISNLFSLYYTNFPSGANAFGSLSGVILALLWLYICMNLVFIGACINEVLYPQKSIVLENQQKKNK